MRAPTRREAGVGLLSLLPLLACALVRWQAIGDYLRQHPVSTMASTAIERRCPLAGLARSAVVLSFGAPAPGSPSSPWIYHLGSGAPTITITFNADTVAAWTADARAHWVRVPPPPSSYDRPRPSQEGMTKYLEAHPALTDAMAYALVRGCGQPGMNLEMVQLIHGSAPFRVDTASDSRGPLVRASWISGLEGQHEDYDFRRDSLVDQWYCGDPSGSQICRGSRTGIDRISRL